DENQCRTSCERGVEIELVDARSTNVERQRRNVFETPEQCGGLDAAMGFKNANDDVDAGATQRLRGDEHRVGLAHAGGRAEKDLQLAAHGARFLGLNFGEKLVGIRPLLFHCPQITRASVATDYRLAASSARLSSRTLTRGSPRMPRERPSVCAFTSARTLSGSRPRALATR